ncbi:MAG: pyridoxal phosphate-dependent aminotransferase [Gammaproteobacteria bacterium]|nr:pyridoxal phosphate-dependent aminotransferase [Gammaproteobacteria bacterium]MBT8133223.1 pyridoxal phosphate-dependent aminotransferase [Gammaproteobacteria bacterium]NNJ50520.1 pyridoxal phosphate-dependent aminotransferase [Gammaproteobacteria bacterium]
MRTLKKSHKLDAVCYDIRGPVHREARRLEEDGHKILKLNIGNPSPFGFDAPEEIVQDMIHNVPVSQGYSDSRGLFSGRKAVMQYSQQKGIANVEIDDVYLGNGASELIVMSMQALINNGDEVLIPAPDYPLWTAAVSLSGGKPVHYLCDEESEWYPDIDDIKSRITDYTRGIVIINPNNPTGAVYPEEVLLSIIELAREHDLIIFSDEIYDKIVYDDAKHISTASLCEDVFCLTYNGLSKAYRVAGFRAGWMIISGDKSNATDYIEGIELLASMRLCSNVPGQHAIQTALGGYQSINELVAPGGRLYEQRNLAHDMLTAIPGISCVKPKGAMYLFAKMDQSRFNISDDEKMVLDLLIQEKILIVHGSAFNWPDTDHFRIVFLPHVDELTRAFKSIANFFSHYKQ